MAVFICLQEADRGRRGTMKVVLIPSDRGGCGQYRMILPALALAAQGHDVEIHERPRVIVQGTKIVGLLQSFHCDVMVFQRPAKPAYMDMIEVCHKEGIKAVFDMDDDLSLIHPLNAAFTPYQQTDMHWKYALEACAAADLVTCTTQSLVDKYGFGHGVLIPNAIPERYLQIEGVREEGIVTVGWSGVTATHPKDLDITHGSINHAISAANSPSRFMAQGDEKAFDHLGIRKRQPHVVSPGVGFAEYPQALSQLDIGIVPLEDTEFNRAKSWLKGLEYAACGVAPVVSPTPDNMRLVEAGSALAASNPREWKETVQLLIENDEERKALTANARKFASTQTIEGNTSRWWDAWTSIV